MTVQVSFAAPPNVIDDLDEIIYLSTLRLLYCVHLLYHNWEILYL